MIKENSNFNEPEFDVVIFSDSDITTLTTGTNNDGTDFGSFEGFEEE